MHGDTDQTPFGLGTYGSRSTPVSGAAAALVARKVRDKARIIASGDARGVGRRPGVGEGLASTSRATRRKSVTIQEIAMRAHGAGDLPEGVEGGLEAQICYNPPNLTYPYGAYICVVDVDPGTAEVKVRRFIAVDDCGTRINPMIIEGQVHGGLTDGVGMALMEMIAFDEDGNCLGASLMDYLIPTALEVPDWETGFTVTPSPHHPIGAKGVGESATVGSPPAIVNAVVDALKPYGVRHADMPLTPSRVWDAMQRPPARRRSEHGSVTEPMSRDHRGPGWTSCAAGRVPFVHATVVRAQQPTSATAGRRRAIVLADGSIEGFVGGQCAESSVRTAACGALRDGETAAAAGAARRRARAFPEAPGAQVVVNPCLSGGALEIFLRAAAAAAAGRGRRQHARSPTRWPSWRGPLGLRGRARATTPAGRRGRAAVVVARHGRDEDERDPGRAGRRRAATSRWWPARGAARRCWPSSASTDEPSGPGSTPRPGSTSAPAPPAEIALSILAEIVQLRRTVDRAGRRAPSASRRGRSTRCAG